jgi:hypothetical protein
VPNETIDQFLTELSQELEHAGLLEVSADDIQENTEIAEAQEEPSKTLKHKITKIY